MKTNTDKNTKDDDDDDDEEEKNYFLCNFGK